ncbi:MAG TPA: hypothetical protein PLN38_08295 [Chitinophagales bacterium]|nr:hypothetical protein [Chitinophagales bacterium]
MIITKKENDVVDLTELTQDDIDTIHLALQRMRTGISSAHPYDIEIKLRDFIELEKKNNTKMGQYFKTALMLRETAKAIRLMMLGLSK